MPSFDIPKLNTSYTLDAPTILPIYHADKDLAFRFRDSPDTYPTVKALADKASPLIDRIVGARVMPSLAERKEIMDGLRTLLGGGIFADLVAPQEDYKKNFNNLLRLSQRLVVAELALPVGTSFQLTEINLNDFADRGGRFRVIFDHNLPYDRLHATGSKVLNGDDIRGWRFR